MSKYTPKRRDDGEVSKYGVMSPALLLCSGHPVKKAMIVYDMLEVEDQGDSDQYIERSNRKLNLIIRCILEFVLIHLNESQSNCNWPMVTD